MHDEAVFLRGGEDLVELRLAGRVVGAATQQEAGLQRHYAVLAG